MSEILNMSCEKCMSQMKDGCIDLIIADPPYYRIKGDFDFVWKNEQEYLAWIQNCLSEFRRILKDTGTLMLWGGLGKNQITLCRISIWIEDTGLFKRQNWITQRNTRGIGTQKNYMSAREDLLFLTVSDNYTFNVPYLEEKSRRKDLGANGKPRKNAYKRVSNVWYDITEASQSSIERCAHPTVKALKLCDRIIKTHSNEQDMIFIPFVGSGSEMISAINNNRRCLGTEISAEYCALAEARINRFSKKAETGDVGFDKKNCSFLSDSEGDIRYVDPTQV